jgi:hypothetical protein
VDAASSQGNDPSGCEGLPLLGHFRGNLAPVIDSTSVAVLEARRIVVRSHVAILPLPSSPLFAMSAEEIFKGFAMADEMPTGPVETGAEMDYEEHVKTYSVFLSLAKYGSLVTAALLLAMAFGFFTSAGIFSATILFILVVAVGVYILRLS